MIVKLRNKTFIEMKSIMRLFHKKQMAIMDKAAYCEVTNHVWKDDYDTVQSALMMSIYKISPAEMCDEELVDPKSTLRHRTVIYSTDSPQIRYRKYMDLCLFCNSIIDEANNK